MDGDCDEQEGNDEEEGWGRTRRSVRAIGPATRVAPPRQRLCFSALCVSYMSPRRLTSTITRPQRRHRPGRRGACIRRLCSGCPGWCDFANGPVEHPVAAPVVVVLLVVVR